MPTSNASGTHAESGVQKRWLLAVPSFLVLWVMGAGFLWWLIIPTILFASRAREKRSIPRVAWVLGGIGFILALSLVAGVAAGETEIRRVAGAGYGALVWVCIAMLYAVLQTASGRQLYYFLRGLIFVVAVQGGATTLAVLLHPSPLSNVALPAASFLGNAGGVAPWTRATLAYNAWFGEPVIRSSGLQASSAWAGGLACLVLIMLIIYRKSLRRHGMSSTSWTISAVLSALSLYYSYTRVSYAILVLVVGYYYLYRFLSRAIPGGGLLSGLLFVVIFLFSYLYLPWSEFLLEQDSLRPGSSEARFSSYFEGVSTATDGGPLVFIVGSGAKPFLEELGRGAGSESTYVSLLVRGGIICLILFCSFLWVRLSQAWKRDDLVTFALLIALAIHAVVEDLDVGTLSIVLALINFQKITDAEPLTLNSQRTSFRSVRPGRRHKPVFHGAQCLTAG